MESRPQDHAKYDGSYERHEEGRARYADEGPEEKEDTSALGGRVYVAEA